MVDRVELGDHAYEVAVGRLDMAYVESLNFHGVAAPDQSLDERAADEPAAPGHADLHFSHRVPLATRTFIFLHGPRGRSVEPPSRVALVDGTAPRRAVRVIWDVRATAR